MPNPDIRGRWKTYQHLIILAIAVIALAVVPMLLFASEVGSAWQGVPTTSQYTDSDLYYARMREFARGNVFYGNPYFIEHQKDLAPSFFLADWIDDAPHALGLSMTATIVWNFLFWSLVTAFLIYALLRTCGAGRWTGVIGSVLAYVTVYLMILRPVSLQVVFPIFLLFCLTAIRWLLTPRDRKRQIAFVLGMTSAIYIYTYLTQIAFAATILLFFWLLWRKRYSDAKTLVGVGLASILLSVPFLIYTSRQLQDPFYWQTMARIGYVATHLPTAEAARQTAVVLATLIGWRLIRGRATTDDKAETAYRVMILFGWAMVIACASNILTGKWLETAEHVGRFVALWTAIAFILMSRDAVRRWNGTAIRRRILYSICLLIPAIFLISFARVIGFPVIITTYGTTQTAAVRELQTVRGPIDWLQANAPTPSVIWTDPASPILDQITILTRHYVLFSNPGILHLLSDDEVQERYLISQYGTKVTTSTLLTDHHVYAGAGAIHLFNTHNRGVRLCQILHVNVLGTNCGRIETEAESVPPNYFTDLEHHYTDTIVPQIREELAKYHVAYYIDDTTVGRPLPPDVLVTPPVYDDGRYAIYEIMPPSSQ